MSRLLRNSAIAVGVAAICLGTACEFASAQLRGHWRLQETDGDSAVDTSPYSRDGDYNNGVDLAASTPVPSDGAVAAKFDGNNDHVAIPNESTYDLTGAMSVGCWIKVDVFDATDQAIVGKGNTAWRLAREGNTNFVQFACNGLSTPKVVSTTGVNDGQWHHVVGVYTGSQLQIYVDGALSNSVNSGGSIGTNNQQVQIARNSELSGREFDGAIYNVVIYAGTLDASAIQTLYRWDGLTAHWKLNETGAATATDSSHIGNSGTYTNGVTLAAPGPYSGLGDKAANFDGNNDYVAVDDEYFYDLAGPMTVAAWIKVDNFDTSDQAILTKGNNAWRLTRDDNNDSVRFRCNGLSPNSVSGDTAVDDGKWHHVVGVYTGSQLQLYIDGVLDNSESADGDISRNDRNVNIARNDQGNGREFDGSVFDVRVYSVPLSAAKVSELFGLVGNWKLAETSGTTAADSSPCSQNGTVSGGASWTTRCSGSGAFDFNGSTHYISIPNATHLQPTQMLSIAAWIKGDSWGAGDSVDAILRKGEGNPNNYQLAIADGRVALYLDDSDSGGTRSATALSTGQWHHVAATWDGSTVRIYVDGALDASAARSGTVAKDTRPLFIGGRPGADQFDGQMQDVHFYNRPLTASEVARLAGQAGRWLFSEGSGSIAADSSLNSNDATLSGGASWTSDCAGYTALQTNGTGGVAETESNFTPPAAGTIAFWMRSAGSPSSTARLFGTGGDWEVRQGTDGKLAFDLCGEAGSSAVSTTALNESGRWYHVVETYNSANDNYSIYVDGQLNKSGTNSNALSQQPADILSFGTRTGSGDFWEGALRDFRVYSRPICASEIAQLFGLVGYWALDESTGTSASDSSGAGNHGTVSGAAAWNVGKINNAFQFNGTTSIHVPTLFGRPKNVTIAAWAKLSAADSNGSEVISLGDSFAIRLDNGGNVRVFFYNGSNWTSLNYNQTYAGAGWHHFAAVFDDDQNFFRLYIDGIQRANASTTASIVYGLGANTVVGRHGNGQTSSDFTGWIDDARVYNRSLCASEIQRLHGGSDPAGVRIIKWVEIQ